ncbi:hypothetical protein [Vibrio sp. 10N.239.312.D08]|uniref:hypothetical protein n=1 Tax=Vibrio sp. 10N.239.312.D08 TaxID=3229978 RepID=UPI0035531C40
MKIKQLPKLANLSVQIVAVPEPTESTFVDTLTDNIKIGDFTITNRVDGRCMKVNAGGIELFPEHGKILLSLEDEPTFNSLTPDDFDFLEGLSFDLIAEFTNAVPNDYHFGDAKVQLFNQENACLGEVEVEVDNEKVITQNVITLVTNSLREENAINKDGFFNVTMAGPNHEQMTTSLFCEKSEDHVTVPEGVDKLSTTFSFNLETVVGDCLYGRGQVLKVTSVCNKSRSELLKYAFS